jgi:hypothetical protein
MKRKYKKGDLVLYRVRDGMGAIPSRIAVAEIVKVSETCYDTKPFNFKKIPSAKGWVMSIFDSDIICRLSRKNASECHRVTSMTYRINDAILSSLTGGIKNFEEETVKYLKGKEKFLKRKTRQSK